MAPNTDVLRREQSEAEEKTIKHAYSTSALEELRQASSRPPLPNQSSPENAMEELERVRLAHQAYDGAGLDEVQRCPALFSYLQGVVDADGRMGRFILTGSQQFGLVEAITQSLAGRVSLLHLL